MTSTTMDLDPPTSLKDKVRHLLDQPNEPTTDRLLVKTAQRPTSMVRHEAFHDAFVCGGRIELGYQMYTTAGDDWDSDDNAKAEESRQVFTTKAIAKRICEDRDHEEVGDGPRILIQFLHQLHDDVIDHLIIGDTGFQLATDPTFHDKFMAPDSCAGLYVVAISTKPGGGFLTGMELKRFVRVGRRYRDGDGQMLDPTSIDVQQAKAIEMAFTRIDEDPSKVLADVAKGTGSLLFGRKTDGYMDMEAFFKQFEARFDAGLDDNIQQ